MGPDYVLYFDKNFHFLGAMIRNDEANPPEAFLNDGIFACGDSLFKSQKKTKHIS